jgi:hypothetical protein
MEVQLAFENREDMPSPAQVMHYQVDQEPPRSETYHSISKELKCYSPIHTQGLHEEEKSQEVAIEAMTSMESKGRDTHQHYEGQGEKRQHWDNNKDISNDVHNLHANIEFDNVTQPAKRQKLLSITTGMPPTPPPEQSLESCVEERHHSHTPPAITQYEIDDPQSQTDHGLSSDLVDNKEQRASLASQSPPAAIETALLAEYHEWPFQGFLKRTRIGNETTYNLEFQLPCTSEHLKLPINSEVLDIGSLTESCQATISHDIPPHSKIAVPTLKKRVKWTIDEENIVIKMKNEDSSWENIQAALPHRTIGTIQVRYYTQLKPRVLLSVASEYKVHKNDALVEESVEGTWPENAARREHEKFDGEDLTIDPVLRNIGRSEQETARMPEED